MLGRVRLACLGILAGAGACKSAPPAPAPAELGLPEGLSWSIDHYAGSLLSGASAFHDAPSAGSEPADALEVRGFILAVERLPDVGLPSLATHSRLVASLELGAPLLPSPLLTPGAVLARGGEARAALERIEGGEFGRARPVRELSSALPRGVTLTASLSNTETVEDPDNYLGEYMDLGPTERRVGVQLSRAGTELEAALVLQGLAPPREDPDPEALEALDRSERLRPGAEIPQIEFVVPDVVPEVDGGPYLWIVRSPFDTGEARAIAIVLEVQRAPADEDGLAEHARELTRVLENVRAAAVRSAAHSEPLPPDDAERRALARAYESLDAARESRETLLYLAGRTDAKLLADVALVSDADTLAVLKTWLGARREEEASAADPSSADDARVAEDALAWELERTAYQLLTTRAMEGALAPELGAVLLRHAGEAGRYPSVLQDLLGASADVESFERYLVEENLFFLEDANPGSRVRAFDWLAAREVAPAGFDPLADASQRRAALARAGERQP